MNLILLYEGDRLPGARPTFRVADHRARHLKQVLGVQLGQTIKVGLLGGAKGRAEITAIDGEAITLVAELNEGPEVPPVDLVLAVPRPKSLKKLLPELAALGVRRLTLLRTWRVEKAFLDSPLLLPSGYEPLLDEGLMQSGTTLRPEVKLAPLFKPFVEDELPGQLEGRTGLVAHPFAPLALAHHSGINGQAVTVALGPEGGFLPYEVEQFSKAGLVPVSLGPRIWRVETAVVAVLAQLELLRQRALAPGRSPPSQ